MMMMRLVKDGHIDHDSGLINPLSQIVSAKYQVPGKRERCRKLVDTSKFRIYTMIRMRRMVKDGHIHHDSGLINPLRKGLATRSPALKCRMRPSFKFCNAILFYTL